MEFTHKPDGEKIVIMTVKEYLELLQWAAFNPIEDGQTPNETPLPFERSAPSSDNEDDEEPISLDWLVDTADDNPWDDPYAIPAPRWEAISYPNVTEPSPDHNHN